MQPKVICSVLAYAVELDVDVATRVFAALGRSIPSFISRCKRMSFAAFQKRCKIRHFTALFRRCNWGSVLQRFHKRCKIHPFAAFASQLQHFLKCCNWRSFAAFLQTLQKIMHFYLISLHVHINPIFWSNNELTKKPTKIIN